MGRFETEVLTQPKNLAGPDELAGEVDRPVQRTPAHRTRSSWTWTVRSARPTASRKARPTTATSSAPATIRCSASTSSATWSGPCCGTATSPAPTTGGACWSRWWPAIASWTSASYFRGDAAFANPEIYEFLEAEGYLYAIRLPANDVLQREIEHLLTRPVGRPSKKPVVWYHDFMYQAASWDQARRVVAKVEWHQGELFPRVGFIVTNLSGGLPAGGAVLQPARHGGAVDQGRQERGELDAAVLPRLRGQPGAAAAVRPGVQPGQLPAAAGPAARA